MEAIEQQTKREKWEALIAEQEKSGLSQREFCKLHELSAVQFGYYRGALKSKQQDHKKQMNGFAPVKINSHASINEVHIILPNGFKCALPVEMDASRVKELIGVLLSC